MFNHCSINNFPLDCWNIVNQYGFKVKKYSELKPKKLEACLELSEDANIIGDTVYYNENKSHNRVRFSLMHELGHIVLESNDESECDKFSSNTIAPRMAIHYSKCRNANDVAKIFILSDQAANIAFDDYRRWRRNVTIYGMSDLDKQMYEHFYNDDAKKFVWSFERCDFCFTDYAYNEQSLCETCRRFEIRKLIKAQRIDGQERNLDLSRSNWLYGQL
ncbi:protein of unknown function DUF955 [Lachnoclostridium phytofermentans ISDg]|uniref:IrrE N-terminal-like domain-containing protein n=1 Tax=Lachnoclostridium phytofermentans (strain ATCC 700394 / DSM 18823 / ISDg) TaxID=357809 RepID=A9KQ40_LACP7|nr:protein of unknown function DUF955 [Lachnoclostridium phytofermentans ISDg]